MTGSFHGLRAALGTDELLGGDGDHQPVFGGPLVGEAIVTWLWGGLPMGRPTLNRFYALHYLCTCTIVGGRGAARLGAARGGPKQLLTVSSRKASATRSPSLRMPRPIKNSFLMMFSSCFSPWFAFLHPKFSWSLRQLHSSQSFRHSTHIQLQYGCYLPFYAILRAIRKLLGVMGVGASIIILALVPWPLDTSKVRSPSKKKLYRQIVTRYS